MVMIKTTIAMQSRMMVSVSLSKTLDDS